MVRVGRLGLRLAKHRRTMQEAIDPLVVLYFRMKNFRNNMRLETKIPLIHPLTRVEAAITAVEMNCLERKNEFLNSLEAVRASHVLNNDYFTSDQIRTAVSHLHAYLEPGGCLVVSRNNDVAGEEAERRTVWIRRPRDFERVEDFNAGS